MKTAVQMTVAEFADLLKTVTAPPPITDPRRGQYARKQRPTDAQQPFWNKRKKGINKR